VCGKKLQKRVVGVRRLMRKRGQTHRDANGDPDAQECMMNKSRPIAFGELGWILPNYAMLQSMLSQVTKKSEIRNSKPIKSNVADTKGDGQCRKK
jgi:hypothetical protein